MVLSPFRSPNAPAATALRVRSDHGWPMSANNKRRWRIFFRHARSSVRWLLVSIGLLTMMPFASGEYGDVVLNQRSERDGERPVIFPHWFHRIRYKCNACHTELGFKMRAGANQVLMRDIANGQFCGACHNGRIAWGPERCELCHSGRAGLTSGIVGGSETRGPGKW
jgi:c(7)-type cytochrome triheme protein